VLIFCNCSSLTSIDLMMSPSILGENETKTGKQNRKAILRLARASTPVRPMSKAVALARSLEDRHLACLGQRAPCSSITPIATSWKQVGRGPSRTGGRLEAHLREPMISSDPSPESKGKGSPSHRCRHPRYYRIPPKARNDDRAESEYPRST